MTLVPRGSELLAQLLAVSTRAAGAQTTPPADALDGAATITAMVLQPGRQRQGIVVSPSVR